jgi:hypothetical protein
VFTFISIIASLGLGILSAMAIVGAVGLAIGAATAGGCWWCWRRFRRRR